MDNRVSLSTYFGTDEPTGGRFFDEISSSAAPTDIMTQSVNLQEGDGIETTAGLFTDVSGLQPAADAVVSPTAVPPTSLPDPATFFDTITPALNAPITSAPKLNDEFLNQSMEGLSMKDQQSITELDRRRDAWIPSEESKKILMKAQSVPAGSFFPEREVLTTPGIILEEELPDQLHSAALRHLGVGEASTRLSLRTAAVPRDEGGVRELIRIGQLRSALTLTTTLITALGQGSVSLGRPSRHTPRSLQLWLTRFSIMARLRLKDALARETEAFGSLDKPDMFYQFYPEMYGARTGSLAPFSLRLLLAEVPLHTGEPLKALDRIHALLAVVRQMLSNLRSGRTEDGSAPLGEQERTDSLCLWSGRETRTLHSLVNCGVALKDYRLAISTTCRLASAATTGTQARALQSALCRLCLQAGHVRGAERHLAAATELRQRLCATADVREYTDRGLLLMAQGRYQDACAELARAAEQDPTDVTVANNTAVCLLYSGRLKEAISVLQKAITTDPERGLCESLVLNLCTLYELESSRTRDKKLALLRTLCKYKSDTLPDIECLKLG